jgi:hypothetical protein
MPQTYRLTPDASGRPPVNTRDDRITRIIGDPFHRANSAPRTERARISISRVEPRIQQIGAHALAKRVCEAARNDCSRLGQGVSSGRLRSRGAAHGTTALGRSRWPARPGVPRIPRPHRSVVVSRPREAVTAGEIASEGGVPKVTTTRR